jgi:hypothetical protein
MLKKEYEVLGQIIKEPWRGFTFREVKELSGKKSGSYVYNSLKRLSGQGILLEKRAGNVVLYSLNIPSMKTQVFAGFVSEYIAWSRKDMPYDDIGKMASGIPAGFHMLIITGSYARGKQKRDSDIDAVIICDDSAEPGKIYSELRHECEMSIPRIHLYVFRRSEFLAMLLDKKANYGKEIAHNNLLLSGGRYYYGIISEAIKNGFNG